MEQERIVYETLMGYRVNDVHWWRTKKAMQACGFQMDKNGFELFINLRKTSPKYYSQFHKIKATLDKKAVDIGEGMKGKDFVNFLEKEGIKPHQSTLSRWFSKAGGYKARAFYSSTVLIPIAAMALIYKSKNEAQLAKVS
ncbi:hypothetical protein H6G06_26800 [Anabaena sphaerica FACHB-251]|uniref:Uncharacterized protein n=1 Tax=Anabaena sphaerica FACHB-251 TaxID=2692883 RepID=A0A926WLU5_9NOST|nr:hypothetical protein [Anabaena sphaerica]MBD2296985.1 hypothetical protein [Anabaena sphaerica FACHB-251]